MSTRNAKTARKAVVEEQRVYDPYSVEKKVRMGMFCAAKLGGEAHWSAVKLWANTKAR
ncbi:hypothetical protein [Paramagnetospirillum kuznetsovii]|nr:hypothetical protein [Paramagnetospirillum kuznetsovii]